MRISLSLFLLAMVLVGAGCVGTQEPAPSRAVPLDYNSSKTQDTSMNTPAQPDITPDADTDVAVEAATAIIKTSLGDITVEFFAQDSPKTVANFVKLASDGFYDGIKFHRIISDFMVQAGDPLTKDDSKQPLWGTGGPGYEFADEFNSHPLVRGSLAMANSGPNTNGSQFFIVTAEATPWLDGNHTNFGRVVDGMDVLDKLNVVATEGPDRPVEPVVIEGVKVQ